VASLIYRKEAKTLKKIKTHGSYILTYMGACMRHNELKLTTSLL